MLGRTFSQAYRLARVALGCGAVLTASGCATPSLNTTPGGPAGPNVAQVEKHITCVLAKTLDKHLSPTGVHDPDDYKLWRHLVDDNFLGTVSLTLFVTKSEGFNPSLNFIDPLTNLGHPIKHIVDSSNGITSPTGVTSNSSNVTLAVGFQLTGLQDRNYVQTYVIDMHRLFDDLYVQKDADGHVLKDAVGNPLRPGALADCAKDEVGPSGGVPYSLKGGLELEETLDSGLKNLAAMPYTPVTAGSAPASKSSQSASTASVSQSSGATSFSAKDDFSLTWGVNGGPSWTLLKFKGPGGATNGLLNYSRQKEDTLITTFSATCKSDAFQPLDDYGLADYFKVKPEFVKPDSPDFTSAQLTVYKRLVPLKPGEAPPPMTSDTLEAKGYDERGAFASERYIITLAIPTDKTGLAWRYSSTGTGMMMINLFHSPQPTVRQATISWSTYYQPDGTYALRGAIADAQSGTFVGYIYAGLTINTKTKTVSVSNLRISTNALAALRAEDKPYPTDYWGSLASCSNAAPFLPNGLNVLQQLPGDVSSALQQQR